MGDLALLDRFREAEPAADAPEVRQRLPVGFDGARGLPLGLDRAQVDGDDFVDLILS